MPMLQKGVHALSGRMPKVLSPTAHAIADYATLGGFVVMGVLFWKHRRRAAVASLGCAAAEAANVLLSDHPGSIKKVINPETHAHIDFALATAASSLPGFLKFNNQPEAKFFNMMGLSLTVVHALTDFQAPIRRPYRVEKRSA